MGVDGESAGGLTEDELGVMSALTDAWDRFMGLQGAIIQMILRSLGRRFIRRRRCWGPGCCVGFGLIIGLLGRDELGEEHGLGGFSDL